MLRNAALAFLVGAGCLPSAEGPVDAEPPRTDAAPPLPPLPSPAAATSDRFTTSEICGQCHLAASGPTLRDAAGRDVSPVFLWRSSMMAMAARDPFYLAVFEEELAANPSDAARAAVEETCTRCHAPQGHLDRRDAGGRLTFAELVSGQSREASLARDGVACALCHQIADRRLGEPVSFSGGYEVDYGRKIFGPHAAPNVEPMQFFVSYTPTYAAHVMRAALCATCHTVVTRRLDAAGRPTGAEFVEQAPYLEWRNSDFNDEVPGRPKARPCRACHVPTTDEDGVEIETRLAVTGATIPSRKPFGRHVFVGGNVWMLRLMSEHADWAGHGVEPGELEAAARRAEAHVREAATISIVEASRAGGELVFTVAVANLAGHKFPTGYPSRRAFLRVRVLVGGEVVFASGEVDAAGRVAGVDDAAGVTPHRREITRPTEVQVYESVPVDEQGRPTHLALAAARYAKDNRLLPAGWSPSHPDAARTAPVGVEDDADFAAGGDRVRFRVAVPTAGALRIEAELMYQSVAPAAIDALARGTTAAAVRFSELARTAPPAPLPVAAAALDVP